MSNISIWDYLLVSVVFFSLFEVILLETVCGVSATGLASEEPVGMSKPSCSNRKEGWEK